jgi:hypothetical protein
LVVAESGPARGERVILGATANGWRTLWTGEARAIITPLLLSDIRDARSFWAIWAENLSRDIRDGPVTRLARATLACRD